MCVDFVEMLRSLLSAEIELDLSPRMSRDGRAEEGAIAEGETGSISACAAAGSGTPSGSRALT